MKAIHTALEGVIVIEPDVHRDSRGWFMESYTRSKMVPLGITVDFVQDNHSFSAKKGTVRGLHYQLPPHAQSKLVRCSRGSIRDVAVDLRPGSPTFGEWISIVLDAERMTMLFIPQGLAHGFVTLEDSTEVQYKVDDFYDKPSERCIRYDDETLAIDWGIDPKHVSEKDGGGVAVPGAAA